MMTPTTRLIGIAFAAAILSCSAAAAADRAVPADARRTIAETNASWLQAMKRQDAPAIAAIYGDDAVFVTADGTTLHGRAAMETFERQRFAATGRVVDGSIADDGLTRAGELIYEWGHVKMQVAAPDARRVAVTGHFVTVWAMGQNGRWHIIRNLSLP